MAANGVPGFSGAGRSKAEVGMPIVTVRFLHSRSVVAVPDQRLLLDGELDPSRGAKAMDVAERSSNGRYSPLGMLSKLPRPITDIDLNTPEIAQYATQAEITLRVFLNTSGKVDNVEVVTNSAVASELVALIVDRFRRARYEPGEMNGVPVPTEFPVTVVVE